MAVRLASLKGLLSAREEIVNWEAVYAEQLPRVYNFFRYRVEDGHTAEDLTAATFEKAWRSRTRYRSDVAGFSTWLFAIARNVATDYFRQRARQRGMDVPLDESAHITSGSIVDEDFERREGFTQLRALLMQLPERERELLALKYGAGLTNRAIARVMKLSESNVGTIAQRAVEKLRLKIGD